MKIVILGAGQVGGSVAHILASEANDVTVVDAQGQPVPGATVNGRWSGLVSGNASAVSGSNGVAAVQSPGSRNRGTFIFTVTGVTLPGYSYDPGSSTETSDSISR